MVQIVLIRPGLTDFDEQGRIKGTLEIPLNQRGTDQVAAIIRAISGFEIESLYSSPCQAARQTADAIGAALRVRVKSVDKLENLDHGLWHGKLIDEVRQCQPKVYRQLQDHPETVCPPDGEPLADAQRRVAVAVDKILAKHRRGVIGIVVPEPVYSLVRAHIEHSELGDLWKAECECGTWQAITWQRETAALGQR
ncbi:MAG: histidine phosphatase family protein [Planctomycetota bacterium]